MLDVNQYFDLLFHVSFHLHRCVLASSCHSLGGGEGLLLELFGGFCRGLIWSFSRRLLLTLFRAIRRGRRRPGYVLVPLRVQSGPDPLETLPALGGMHR